MARKNVSTTAVWEASGFGQTRTSVEPAEKANLPTPAHSTQDKSLPANARANTQPYSSIQSPTARAASNAGATPLEKTNLSIRRYFCPFGLLVSPVSAEEKVS